MGAHRVAVRLSLLLALCTLVGCAPRWELSIRREDNVSSVTGRQWAEWLKAYPSEASADGALALERVLWEAGVLAADAVEVAGRTYAWTDVRADAWLLKSGELRIAGESVRADSLTVTQPKQAAQARIRLTDVAPTVAGALGVRSPRNTTGRAIAGYAAEHVIVVAIDGLSYLAYDDVRGQGVARVLDSLGAPKLTLAAYPSSSPSAALAILRGSYAGALAEDPAESLFDVLSEAERAGVAVLPSAPQFELGAVSRLVLAADGSTAATVDAALDVLQSNAPALLWLQLDGLWRAAQAHGLGTEEVTHELESLDLQLQRVVSAAPPSSLLIVLGTAGLHPDVAGAGVTDGALLASDMFVPLWVAEF